MYALVHLRSTVHDLVNDMGAMLALVSGMPCEGNETRGVEKMLKMNMFRAAVFAGALAVPMAATTSAQPAVIGGGGLVNVQIGSIEIIDDVEVRNVLNDLNVGVGVAANIAANVCGTTVGVLAQDLARGANFACDSDAGDAFVRIVQ